MTEVAARKLIEALSTGTDRDRAYTVANLLFQFESYILNASMSIAGLMAKHPEAARDVFAHKQMLDELSMWASGIYLPLYTHSGFGLPGQDERPGVVH